MVWAGVVVVVVVVAAVEAAVVAGAETHDRVADRIDDAPGLLWPPPPAMTR